MFVCRVLAVEMPSGDYFVDFPFADAAGHYTETDLCRALTAGFNLSDGQPLKTRGRDRLSPTA